MSSTHVCTPQATWKGILINSLGDASKKGKLEEEKLRYTGGINLHIICLYTYMRLNINLVNLARLDIKDIARNRHILDRSILPQKLNISLDALLQVLDGQECNVADILASVLLDSVAEFLLVDEKHAAVSLINNLSASQFYLHHSFWGDNSYVVDNDNFFGSKSLLGNDQGAQRLGSSSSCIAVDVGVALFQAEELGWVQTGVHASQDENLSKYLISY